MKISKNFVREEFACKCGCGFDVVDVMLLTVLEQVRKRFSSAVSINSACRCLTHNATVGGSPASQHPQGKAADIVVSGVAPYVVHDYLHTSYPEKFGIGNYKTFTHIDVRDKKARWKG